MQAPQKYVCSEGQFILHATSKMPRSAIKQGPRGVLWALSLAATIQWHTNTITPQSEVGCHGGVPSDAKSCHTSNESSHNTSASGIHRAVQLVVEVL